MGFKFHLPTRETIIDSPNGDVMISAIDDDFPEKSIFLSGCPGSGKTTISLHRLRRILNEGKNALLFTFQNLLRISMQNLLHEENIPREKVSTLFKWYFNETRGFYSEDAYQDIIDKLHETDLNPDDYDELIIDEGQDLDIKTYKTLPGFFKKTTVGADNGQKVIADKGCLQDEINNELEQFGKVYKVLLQYNYRNTYEIYNFARRFVPDNPLANDPLTLHQLDRDNDELGEGNSERPMVYIYRDEDLMKRRLGLLLDNFRGSNIAVLLPRKEDVEKYSEMISSLNVNDQGFSCSKFYSDFYRDLSNREKKEYDQSLEDIVVTTFVSAKGLEFDVVILPEFQDAVEERKKQYYVACTRAKRNVFIFCEIDMPDILKGIDATAYELKDLDEEFVEIEYSEDEDLPF